MTQWIWREYLLWNYTIHLQVIFDVQAMTQPCKNPPSCLWQHLCLCVPAPLIPLDPPPAGRLLRNVRKGDVIRLDWAVLSQTAERRLKGPVTPAGEDPPSVGFPSGESRRRISGRLLALRLASFPWSDRGTIVKNVLQSPEADARLHQAAAGECRKANLKGP